nr:MAG: hypothetical protein [Bacteriophage sp.]
MIIVRIIMRIKEILKMKVMKIKRLIMVIVRMVMVIVRMVMIKIVMIINIEYINVIVRLVSITPGHVKLD